MLAIFPALMTDAAHAEPQLFRVSTSNYDVATDVSMDLTRRVAAEMEGIHAEYMRRFGRFANPAGARSLVYVFAHEEEYLNLGGYALKGTGGFFNAGRGHLAAYIGDRTLPQLFRILYHEGFHQFMHARVSRDCPLWLNEGMAEYYGAALPTSKGYETGDVAPYRIEELKECLKGDKFANWSRFLLITSEEWHAARETPGQAGVNYLQAWSMVHFLIHGRNGKLTPVLDRYIDSLKRGASKGESMRNAFGSDMLRIEDEWKDFIEGMETSPRYVCWDNLEFVATILSVRTRAGGRPKTFEEMIDGVPIERLEGPLKLTTCYGTEMSASTRAELEAICRCPLDKNAGKEKARGKYSYIFSFEDGPDKPPAIVCPCHGLITYEAKLNAREDGSFYVVVSEGSGKARAIPFEKAQGGKPGRK